MSTTDRQLAFVQFPHPRVEHAPKSGDFMDWNTGSHARKFMASSGKYVTRDVGGDRWKKGSGDLVFWGEWEAQSRVERPFNQPERWLPQVLHHPVLGPSPAAGSYQNTDPFVFGDRMRYTICRQHRDDGYAVPLRRLAPWSVILFGSSADGLFILDTVFVVSDEIAEWSANDVPAVTRDITDGVHHRTTIEPVNVGIKPEHRDLRFHLYNGVTYAERKSYGGMFSFTPCQLRKDSPKGFERPTIKLDGFINPKSTRTIRCNMREINGDRDLVVGLWNEVVDQVIEQGCALAHNLALPASTSKGDGRVVKRQRTGVKLC